MKFKINEAYEIFFKDHSAGLDSIMNCKIIGYIIDDKESFVHISPWVVITDDKKVFNDNLESFCILKSAIDKRKLIT